MSSSLSLSESERFLSDAMSVSTGRTALTCCIVALIPVVVEPVTMDSGPTMNRLWSVPTDIAATLIAAVVVVTVVLVPWTDGTLLPAAVGVPFVTLVPGYAVTAVLFPASSPADSDLAVSFGVRLALSIGLSLLVLVIVGVSLGLVGAAGIRTVVASAAVLTVATGAAAVHRRRSLPPSAQFRLPSSDDTKATERSRVETALTVMLIVGVIVAVAGVGYALVLPAEQQSFTELYILTEQDGQVGSQAYPQEFALGEARNVTLGIDNHEDRPVEYTVQVQLQQVRVRNNSTQVIEQRNLDRIRTRLADGETWRERYEVTPTMVGDSLRVAFRLYTGDQTAGDPYRETYLWIDVTSPSDG